MELQTVKTVDDKLIASGTSMDDISIRRTGIAKVLWRKLDVEVPKSEVIANGVNIYKNIAIYNGRYSTPSFLLMLYRLSTIERCVKV